MHNYGPAPGTPIEVFAGRRKKLLEMIGDGIAVVPAAPELFKSRDTEVRYRQSSDLYYLTGFHEQESVAVITPHADEGRFILFLRERDPEREVWDGTRVGVERAGDAFGADAVYPIGELATRLPDLLKKARTVHYPIGLDPRLDQQVMEAIGRARRGRQRKGEGPIGAIDLEAATGVLRLIKDAHEIERIRTATAISADAHRAAMRACRPGVGEWEVQAALEATMRALGAEGPAFVSIVGSGVNATTLHYVANSRPIRDGDLVLVDAGAEWGLYAGDITRTFPASGRFSGPQRELYDVVLAAEEAAIAAARPGSDLPAVHDAALRVLVRGLLDLRILSGDVDSAIEDGTYKRFYMHQTSHWLGLDVHDVGLYGEGDNPVPLAPGMVFTIEPGLYIPDADDVPAPFRATGIRIEDDVLITPAGHDLLTRGAPVDPADIETLVGTG